MAPPEEGPRPRGRRRAAHSMEAILRTSISLLDASGEAALTFRALAAELGGGVGSFYWYVSSKDELLQRCADAVVGQMLDLLPPDHEAQDPLSNLRRTALALYEVMDAHHWLGRHLMLNVTLQPESLKLYERLGRQLQRLDLTSRQRFHAVSAIMGYVTGIGTDLGRGPETMAGLTEADRDAYIAAAAQSWTTLDPEQFGFIHEMAPEFAHHDDADQFTSGLDLLLAGLRLQAEGGQA